MIYYYLYVINIICFKAIKINYCESRRPAGVNIFSPRYDANLWCCGIVRQWWINPEETLNMTCKPLDDIRDIKSSVLSLHECEENTHIHTRIILLLLF